MIRVLLADRHQLLHPGIHSILSTTNNYILVDAVTCNTQLQQRCLTHQPDVVLLALNIVDLPYIDVIDHLQLYCPTAKILILLHDPDEVCLHQLLEHGIDGGIFKNDAPEKLLEAIETIVAGKTWFSPYLMSQLLQRKVEKQAFKLTERELDVLNLVVEEKTDKEIAQALSIAERTVRCHLQSVFVKLGARTRLGAAVTAIRLGLVQNHDL